MTDKPSQKSIDLLVERKTPEQLASAYLSASRRANEAEAIVRIMKPIVQMMMVPLGIEGKGGDIDKDTDPSG